MIWPKPLNPNAQGFDFHGLSHTVEKLQEISLCGHSLEVKVLSSYIIKNKFLIHVLTKLSPNSRTLLCMWRGLKCLLLFFLPAQDNLKNKGFGQDLPSVENEVEEHNIFHSEVEALAPHISTSGDKVNRKPEGLHDVCCCIHKVHCIMYVVKLLNITAMSFFWLEMYLTFFNM